MTDFLNIEKSIQSIRDLKKEKMKRQRKLEDWYFAELVKLYSKDFRKLIEAEG